MRKFEKLVSEAAVLNRDDIDTDQIIPARFLRTTERTGLGQHLFEDWRYAPGGEPRPTFVLNQPQAQDAHILIGGRNFGCGSSREHAVWALLDFGIWVVISMGFAEIFAKNSLRNGLLPITVDEQTHQECLAAAERHNRFTVDLETRRVTTPEGLGFDFEVDSFARTCLLEGVDDLEYILQHQPAIEEFERQR